MPIQEISSAKVQASTVYKLAKNDSHSFLDALKKAGSAPEATTASNPIASGKSYLSADYWPERFDARVDAGAENAGMETSELKAEFAAIMEKAAENGGFSDPKTFLKSLSSEERQIIQAVQGLADEITASSIDGLSAEGSLNLLLPPGAQRDWNDDGIYSVGRGNSFRFPTDNTPAHVKEAWAETTKDMSFEELMMAEAHMMSVQFSANFHADASGNVTVYEPGDPEFTNPFGDMNYALHAEQRLAWNEHIRNQISIEQYERDKNFWSKFSAALGQIESIWT